LGKVFERMLYARANAAAEAHSLRAPTQCGFREGHGSLDGLFVLRHLIDRARHDDSLLFCLFVDFEKAFDTVPRGEMLDRCRALGMHGAFLQAVAAMYENILMAVKSHGSLGPTFATTQGTKQGGELSPLLFGLFIEQLHELLLRQCPGMGPVIGGMPVPDLLYADDVACLTGDPTHLQHFLDTLHLFCRLFGMRVSTGKTFIVIFGSTPSKLPTHIKRFTWLYAGQPVAIKPEFKYLGIIFHCVKGMRTAGGALAAGGRRAMHALLARLRAAHISQAAFQVRLFRVLVEPVLSYGCQVWGPDMFEGGLALSKVLAADSEVVQLDFLRFISGLPKSVSRWVLLREFGARPLHLHWLTLCARFWAHTLDLPEDCLLRKALVADVELFVSGCQDCWAAKFLLVMQQLGVVTDSSAFANAHACLHLRIVERAVADAAERFFTSMWVDLPADPATAPSDSVVFATYHQWVCGGAPLGQPPSPLMQSLVLLRHEKTCLCRLRVGSLDLRIHTNRFSGLARARRTCQVCDTGEVDDLPHFLLRCPVHARTREMHANIFGHPHSTHQVLAHADQRTLARCVLEMLASRQALLPAGA
jgi:hypothetical protein